MAAPETPQLAYIELAVRDVAASRDFFARAFGWGMIDYGPGYAGSVESGTELGLHGDAESGEANVSEMSGKGTDATEALAAAPVAPPLPGIRVADLAAAEDAVRAAGGEIVVPAFAFPGGRRFEFREPSGNRLAVFV